MSEEEYIYSTKEVLEGNLKIIHGAIKKKQALYRVASQRDNILSNIAKAGGQADAHSKSQLKDLDNERKEIEARSDESFMDKPSRHEIRRNRAMLKSGRRKLEMLKIE